ncbi:MAG: hypothetical protein QM619_03285 [Micropruina sp.]|uniref:hypothetical protein n=1 Tax=Micropruina sp. TaxID=2737536 RepID=UPI0039E352F6
MASRPDPTRLRIFAAIALLGWLLGPLALPFFAGYWLVWLSSPAPSPTERGDGKER